MDLREYIVRQIETRRAFERRVESFCQSGILPRVGISKPPTVGQIVDAAAISGDVAAERMYWEEALRLYDRQHNLACEGE